MDGAGFLTLHDVDGPNGKERGIRIRRAFPGKTSSSGPGFRCQTAETGWRSPQAQESRAVDGDGKATFRSRRPTNSSRPTSSWRPSSWRWPESPTRATAATTSNGQPRSL